MSEPDPMPAPRERIEALERSRADLEAGRLVPMEEVSAEFDAELEAYESERRAREAMARTHSTTP